MATKTIEVGGNRYRVRYLYQRDDGTEWYVLNVPPDGTTPYGECGDEWPKQGAGGVA